MGLRCRATHLVAPHDQRDQQPARLDAGWSSSGLLQQRRPLVDRRRRQRPSREPARRQRQPFRGGGHPRRPCRGVPGSVERSQRDSEHDPRFGSRLAPGDSRHLRRIRTGALAGREVARVPVRRDGADGGLRPAVSGARSQGVGVPERRHGAGLGTQRAGVVLPFRRQPDGGRGRPEPFVCGHGTAPAVHRLVRAWRYLPGIRRRARRPALHHAQRRGGPP